MPNNILDSVQVGSTDYDLVDANAIHTINEVAPVDGELSVVNGISIVDGQLCVTYTKEVDD